MASDVYRTARAKVSLPSAVFECGGKFYVIKSNSNTQAHAERETILLSSRGIFPFKDDIYTWIIVKSGKEYKLYAKRLFTPLEIFTKHLQLSADLEYSVGEEPAVIYAGEFTVPEGPENRPEYEIFLSESESSSPVELSAKRPLESEGSSTVELSAKRYRGHEGLAKQSKTTLTVNLASGSFAPQVNRRSLSEVTDVFERAFPTATIEVTDSLTSLIPQINCEELINLGRRGMIDIFEFSSKEQAEAFKVCAIELLKAEMRKSMLERSGAPINTDEICRLKVLSTYPKKTFKGGKSRRKKPRIRRTRR
jgi:hypothetical protein